MPPKSPKVKPVKAVSPTKARGIPYDIDSLIRGFEQSGGFQTFNPGVVAPVVKSPVSDFDVATFLLNRTNVDWEGINKTNVETNKQSKSTMSRIFDILSRPNYMSAEMFKRTIQHLSTVTDPVTGKQISLDKAQGLPDKPWYADLVDILHGGVSGLAGTRKTTYSKLVNTPDLFAAPWEKTGQSGLDWAGADSPAAKFAIGLLADIGLDPLTYAGVGPLKLKNIPGAQHIPGIKSLPSVQQKYGTGLKNTAPNATQAPQLGPQLSVNVVPKGAIPTTLSPKTSYLPTAMPTNVPSPFSPGLGSANAMPPQIQQILGSILPGGSVGRVLTPDEIKSSIPKNFLGNTAEDFAGRIDNARGVMTPEELKQIVDGNPRKASQALADLERSKGYTGAGAAQDIEKILRNISPENPTPLANLLEQIHAAPVNKKGIAEFAEKEAANVARLQDANQVRRTEAQLKKPLVGYSGRGIAPNVEKAEDIIAKIAAGDIPSLQKLAPPPSSVAAPSPAHSAAAIDAATKYADRFLRPNATTGFKGIDFNPAKQANFFQNVLITKLSPGFLGKNIKQPMAKAFQPARFTHAYRMLKVAEDEMIAKGFPPTYWDGSHLRLSEVIDHLGGPTKITQELFTQLMDAWKLENPAKITNPEIRNAIEKLRSKSALINAKWVNNAVATSVQQASVVSQVLSPARMRQFQATSVANTAKNAKASGQAMSAIAGYKHLVTTTFRQQYSLPQKTILKQGGRIQAYVTPGQKGVSWAKIQQGQTAAIGQVIGQAPKLIAQGDQSKWLEWFGTRFVSFYGQKEFRPEMLNYMAAGVNAGAMRNSMWQDVPRRFDSDDIGKAFSWAQSGATPPPGTSQELMDLSQRFKYSLESLFMTSGLSDDIQKGMTVALRSGTQLPDLNHVLKMLGSPYQFTNAKKVLNPNYGKVKGAPKYIDYSKGADWLKSWETMDIKDPLNFMLHVENATEQLMKQYAWMDEIAAHFGSPVATATYSAAVTAPRLKGTYFDPEIAKQVQRAYDTFLQIYNPKSPFMKNFDQLQRTWKTLVTIPNPSHHIRNIQGDGFLNFIAGVNNPIVYKTAADTIRTQRKLYQPLKDQEAGDLASVFSRIDALGEVIGKDAISKALNKGPTGGSKALTTRSGITLTHDQVYTLALNNGILSRARVLEEIVGDPLIKWKPFGGKVAEKVYGVTEVRDHWMRLAHFNDLLKKSKNPDIEKAASEAAQVVRKWHPDGLDLTKFERDVMRRLIPFYSWTRKSVPLVIESILTRPGKVMMYPKAMYSLQQAMGMETESPSNPFPGDMLFPDFVRAKGIGPLFGNPETNESTIVNPSNPVIDTVAQFGGFASGDWEATLRGMGSMLTPGLKIPAEVLTGTQMTGIPISYDPSRYYTEQIPLIAQASRMSNYDLSFAPTERGLDRGTPNWPAIINFLTALGVIQAGNYTKQASFEERERSQ